MISPPVRTRSNQSGYVVLATTISIFVLVGMLALALDLGRIFIVKSETQALADAAAISAARFLNGTAAGVIAARNSIYTTPNRINFATQTVTAAEYTIEFSNALTGPWESNPTGNLGGFAFLRVTVRPSVTTFLMPVLGGGHTMTLMGRAIAAQVPQTFPAGGYLPFTPFALNPADPSGNFGMIIGQEYAFLWPGRATLANTCAGNQVNWPSYNFSLNSNAPGSERGYFEFQSASDIADAVMGLKQTSPLALFDPLPMTNGRKNSTERWLEDRAALDTDTNGYAPSNSGIRPSYAGNGMRLVTLPINSGNTTAPPNQVLGFGAFLLPMTIPTGGNRTWCAIYMGSSVVGGRESAYPGAGAYMVRLVE